MQLNELRELLAKFDIEDKVIDKFLKNKIIQEKDKNLFLVKEKLKEKEVMKEDLIYINLRKLLPTKFLLEFIKNNSLNLIEIEKEKQAIDFTYGKDIEIKSTSKGYQIVLFQNRILGYGELENNKLKNLMNIGDYLREN